MVKGSSNLVIGVLLVAAATVLLVAFRETEFWWFRGQQLGIILGILGLLDLLEAFSRDKRRTSRESSDPS